MQQIYAEIQHTSKYHGQGAGLFPVKIQMTGHGGENNYLVQGGPGGQYSLTDVSLYIKDGPDFVRIK